MAVEIILAVIGLLVVIAEIDDAAGRRNAVPQHLHYRAGDEGVAGIKDFER